MLIIALLNVASSDITDSHDSHTLHSSAETGN
jgi:hypothetical protein